MLRFRVSARIELRHGDEGEAARNCKHECSHGGSSYRRSVAKTDFAHPQMKALPHSGGWVFARCAQDVWFEQVTWEDVFAGDAAQGDRQHRDAHAAGKDAAEPEPKEVLSRIA
jgi:hypothetical protein